MRANNRRQRRLWLPAARLVGVFALALLSACTTNLGDPTAPRGIQRVPSTFAAEHHTMSLEQADKFLAALSMISDQCADHIDLLESWFMQGLIFATDDDIPDAEGDVVWGGTNRMRLESERIDNLSAYSLATLLVHESSHVVNNLNGDNQTTTPIIAAEVAACT